MTSRGTAKAKPLHPDFHLCNQQETASPDWGCPSHSSVLKRTGQPLEGFPRRADSQLVHLAQVCSPKQACPVGNSHFVLDGVLVP